MKCSAGNPNPNPNPNPDNPMSATHFHRALARINRNAPVSSSLRCSRRIKRAAYASMARAAGPKRAWSRAILNKLRGRGRATAPCKSVEVAGSQPNRADVLRRLVPGGEAMDFCTLLEEIAHYIQCLTAQVRLMQSLVDSMST